MFYEVSAKNGSNLNNVILLHSMINKYFFKVRLYQAGGDAWFESD